MSSPNLPPEIFDYIVDLLHAEPQTLQNCSLVAKSWIPRARKHLFATIKFDTPEALQSWKKIFPDPSNSPAHYTYNLSIRYSKVIAVTDATESSWIPTFPRVARLTLDTSRMGHGKIPFALFHRFSRTLKSLYVGGERLPCSRLFDFVLFLPLLEDLRLSCYNLSSSGGDDSHVQRALTPSIPPAFTGSLGLLYMVNIGNAAQRLLDLPNGLHFRKLTLTWCDDEDLQWLRELVVACCNTLESLDIMRLSADTSTPVSVIHLSEAQKLQEVTFRTEFRGSRWIAAVLETITPRNQNLKELSICICDAVHVGETVGERTRGQWSDVDSLLVQVWEMHSIRLGMTWNMLKGEERAVEEFVGQLLPEVTKRGILDGVK